MKSLPKRLICDASPGGGPAETDWILWVLTPSTYKFMAEWVLREEGNSWRKEGVACWWAVFFLPSHQSSDEESEQVCPLSHLPGRPVTVTTQKDPRNKINKLSKAPGIWEEQDEATVCLPAQGGCCSGTLFCPAAAAAADSWERIYWTVKLLFDLLRTRESSLIFIVIISFFFNTSLEPMD